jgi:hypothetical protein
MYHKVTLETEEVMSNFTKSKGPGKKKETKN